MELPWSKASAGLSGPSLRKDGGRGTGGGGAGPSEGGPALADCGPGTAMTFSVDALTRLTTTLSGRYCYADIRYR